MTLSKKIARPALALLLLALAGCSTAPPQTPFTADAGMVPPRLSLAQADDVTLHAVSLVGTPYVYGGNTPASGFDCSGLINYVYKAQAGIVPPRTVAALANWGQPVSVDAVKTGDLVIFFQHAAATHAGIYVGDGRFVHAPSTGGEVRLDRLGSPYWSKQQMAFIRP